MCNLAKQALIDGRDLFLSTLVVTSQMPNKELFKNQQLMIFNHH